MVRRDDESEKRVEAERLAEAFFQLLTSRYGLKPEDIPEILEDMRWVREHRRGVSRVGWTLVLGVIGVAAAGLASMFWAGFKSMVTR